MSEHQYMPLWKQLLGAATGAVVALLLYGGFAAASPNLSTIAAYLIPVYPQSPRTIRDETIARREALGDRARAAAARLQKGEQYFKRSEALASSSASSASSSLSSMVQKQSATPKERDGFRVEMRRKEQPADAKHAKEEKLPDTGIPLWAIGSVAFGIAMAVRYRRELFCSPSPTGRG